jgi:hypothetical protein
MAGVAIGSIGRHDLVFDVVIDETVDFRRGLQQAHFLHEGDAFGAFGFGCVFEFSNDPEGGDEFILPSGQVPPFTSPVAVSSLSLEEVSPRSSQGHRPARYQPGPTAQGTRHNDRPVSGGLKARPMLVASRS